MACSDALKPRIILAFEFQLKATMPLVATVLHLTGQVPRP